ncbi:MAG TPA: alpha/beta fold hydrolase [Alphaproteobacteria bacterium]|nr:alpha/beta fold hydrolase [Alphaproteobacteria bacterium]
MMDSRGAAPLIAPFRQRAPWWGADLQTVRNALNPLRPSLAAFRSERLRLPMADGMGDVLVASLSHPASAAARPLVILIHGLTGCEDSVYMRASARFWLKRGHAVLRVNLRGAGPSRPTCRDQYHAGRTEDLRRALAVLDPALAANGLVLVGYSLGANMLLKYLGEEGAQAPCLAAVSVSAPIDLAATSAAFHRPRNRIYLHYLLSRMKAESLAPGAMLNIEERRRIKAARSVREFDDRFVAPRNGFAGADDYYARSAALPFLAGIKVPTLIVHALDDPWISAEAYLCYRWRGNPHLEPLIATRGGHVGFHGADAAEPWHDRAAGAFLDRVVGAAA